MWVKSHPFIADGFFNCTRLFLFIVLEGKIPHDRFDLRRFEQGKGVVKLLPGDFVPDNAIFTMLNIRFILSVLVFGVVCCLHCNRIVLKVHQVVVERILRGNSRSG